MAKKNSQNPLNNYTDSATIPEQSINGIVINKRYAFTGAIDAISNQKSNKKQSKTKTVYSSPQSTQTTPAQPKTLVNASSPSAYWSSSKDSIGSKTVTGIQISLTVPNSSSSPSNSQTQQTVFFNYISFEIQDVPANWSIYFQDPLSGTMFQLSDFYGNPVGGSTSGQNPGTFNLIEIYSQTVSTSLIELRFDRDIPFVPNSNKPKINPYAFTIGNLDISLLAENDYFQIPDNAVLATKTPQGTTEQYIKVQRDSSQIQSVSNNRTDELQPYYWRSEPQAVGDAVVNLYTDLGTQNTFDTLYLDPLYSGVRFNVYSSNDNSVSQDFWCSRNQTSLTQADMNNPISFLESGEQLWGPFGNTRTGAIFTGSLANNAGLIAPGNIQIDGTQSWSMGIKFTPAANILASGSKLIQNQELISPSGKYSLKLTNAGVLGIYKNSSSTSILNVTIATGSAGSYLSMQSDGKLILYNANGIVVWKATSGSAISGSYLSLNDNGTFVVYSPTGSTLYTSSAASGGSVSNYGGTLFSQVVSGTSTETVKLSYLITANNNSSLNTITINGIVNGQSQNLSQTFKQISMPNTGWTTAPYTVVVGYDNTDPFNPYAYMYMDTHGSNNSTITAISPGTPSSGFVQYTTSSPHGFSIGQRIIISGITGGNGTGGSSYSGDFTIYSIPTTTTFTVSNNINNLSTTVNQTGASGSSTTISVVSTANAPTYSGFTSETTPSNPAGYISVPASGGTLIFSYTGTTNNSFTGCVLSSGNASWTINNGATITVLPQIASTASVTPSSYVSSYFTPNASTPFVYDGASGANMGVSMGYPGVITIGNDAQGGNPANAIAQDFFIKQTSISNSVFNTYVSQSRSFVDSYGPKNTPNGTPNIFRGDYKALLLARMNNANVYSGPSSEYYEAKSWTPIKFGLQLRKSTYSFNSTNARYIKLEFTNLQPKPYVLNTPIIRNTKLFPQNIIDYAQNNAASYNLTPNNYQAQGTNGVPSTIPFNNSPIIIPTAVGSAYTQILNPPTQGELNASQTGSGTQTILNAPSAIVDITSQSQSIVSQDPTVNPTKTPYFPIVGTHTYRNLPIEQTWQQAYFVGLKAMQFYQHSQTTTDDTEYYYDNCTSLPGATGSIANPSIFDYSQLSTAISGSGMSGSSTTLSVAPASIFPNSGAIDVITSNGTLTFTYTGSTISSFTGCVLSVGNSSWAISSGDMVKSSNINCNFTTPFTIYEIDSATPNTGSVTYNTNGVNGFKIGQFVTVNGVQTPTSSTTNYNGTFIITSVSTTGTTSSSFTVNSNCVDTPKLIDSNNNYIANADIMNGYQATTSGQVLYTLPLTSFSTVNSFQLSAITSDWKSLLLSNSHALMSTDNIGYNNFINIQDPIPVSQASFQLRSGIWQINPTNGNIPSGGTAGNMMSANVSNIDMVVPYVNPYGMSTPNCSLPSSVVDQVGLRVSAAARIYLPLTCDGTYTINLYAYFSDGTKQLVASNSQILTCFNWHDLQVAWSIPAYPNNLTVLGLQAEILQTDTYVSEVMYITMLSAFYHPISWSWTNDQINFQQITTTVNKQDGYVTVNNPNANYLNNNLNSFRVRMKAHETGAYLNSILINPEYSFDPYTPSASIDYFPHPTNNENLNAVAAQDQPMFMLSNDFFPQSFSLNQISLITNPLK